MRKLPETIPDEGLLVGWSLEPGYRKSIVGFKEPDHDSPSPAMCLEAIIDTGEGHLLTVAPTGAGKGTGCIIPALLRYRGPVVVVDPKGENYAVTARRRKEMGQEVIVLDPFKITNAPEKHHFNPLDLADPASDRFIEDVATIANLIASDQASANSDNYFWSQMGSTLISAAIIDVLTMTDSNGPTLGGVRDLINMPYNDLIDRAKRWQQSDNRHLQQLAGLLENPADVTVGGYLAFAVNQLDFLKGELMRDHLSSSDLDLNKVYDGSPLTIYLVLPPDKLESHSALLRLWIGTLITVITRRQSKPADPTLLLLDEAAQMGTLPQLRQAITLLRGYGVRVWSFWQDLSQLKNLYEKDWETILNNSRIQQFFGATTAMSAEVICRVSGYGTPGAVMDLELDELILNITGDEAVIAAKPNYLYDPAFVELFDPNPFYPVKGDQKERVLHTRPVFRKSSISGNIKSANEKRLMNAMPNRYFHPVSAKNWTEITDNVGDFFKSEDNKTLGQAFFTRAGIMSDGFIESSDVMLKICYLPFYDDYNWFDIIDSRSGTELHSYYLMGNEKALLLNGSSAPIHEVNEQHLNLDRDNVKLYLEFFCTSVHGDDGRFLIIDNINEIVWKEKPDEAFLKDLEAHIHPPRIVNVIEEKEDSTFELEAVILYDDDLFTAKFMITKKLGMVEMNDDEPIASDLPVFTDREHLRYVGRFDQLGHFTPMLEKSKTNEKKEER